MRSSRVLIAVALVAGALLGASLSSPPPVDDSGMPAHDQLLAPGENESEGYIWPYTSRSQSVSGRTLAINVLVRGEPTRVKRALTDRSEANWSTTGPEAEIDVSPWQPAHGSTRYTYVGTAREEAGHWQASNYQLEVGDYLGTRTHVRAYVGPSGEWTALQTHTEYWDWFRLRHTVTGLRPGAEFVAHDLRDEPFVTDVSRAEHGLEGGGSDGEWTVIDLVPTMLVGVVTLPIAGLGWRRYRRVLALPVGLVALVLAVRFGGLAGEELLSGCTPKLVAAVGYPVLVTGPPLLVGALAGEKPPGRVGLLATGGLATGLVLDSVLTGLPRLPGPIVGHRIALATALGLLAFGVARDDRRVIGVGILAWGVTLAAPLFGFV